MTEETASTLPLTQRAVSPIVEPHLGDLAQVLLEAWGEYAQMRERSSRTLAQASASSRAMLVSDLMRQPAHRIFRGVSGVSVDDRHRRPWVNFAHGSVQCRFRKLSDTLAVCTSDSDRATRLCYHLGDPSAPTLEGLDREATVLTAGYVLDPSEQHIQRLALTCHIGDVLYYHFTLPGGAATAVAPQQLPLAALTEPIIRSARRSAAGKLRNAEDSE